jgi:hypothetical protein
MPYFDCAISIVGFENGNENDSRGSFSAFPSTPKHSLGNDSGKCNDPFAGALHCVLISRHSRKRCLNLL